jgi:hypothetical protein
MAREQVQNLPTRGIRPANVQAGQYRVAVQQAPESQLMGLACQSWSTELRRGRC